MKYRKLGKTNYMVSEISLGTWQVGGKWGEPFSHTLADKILNKALEYGINFIDTADVYSDGESEKAVGRFVRSRSEKIYVATKCGRQLNPHTSDTYQKDVLRKFVDDSLKRMELETIDLIQLHCPPTEVYYRPEIFDLFDDLKKEGKIQNLGVSIEKVDEGIQALEYPNVTSIQIIFNMFRQKPAEMFFQKAAEKNVGIIVRVPLASGLLTGSYDKDTVFGSGDHRTFNRNGEAFDKGETFSGVDFATGLKAVHELKKTFPQHSINLALLALRWILMHKEISCVIPGVSKPMQIDSNMRVMDVAELSERDMQKISNIYTSFIKDQVHHLW